MYRLLCLVLLCSLSLPAGAAERVIALTSLTADLLQTLAPQKLIGITNSSLLEQDPRFKTVPTIGLGNSPSLEKILALKPDLVVGAEGFHNKLALKLQEFKIKTILFRVDSWDDLTRLTQQLATATKSNPASLLKRYQTLLPKPAKATTALILVGIQPILAPTGRSWAGQLLTRYGFINSAATAQDQGQFKGYTTLSPEQILVSNPQTLLVVTPEGSESTQKVLANRPFWSQLQAIQNQQVYSFSYYGLINPGSLAQIEAVCRQLQQLKS